MGINRWWRSSSTILDRTSLPLVQHRPTRRTDLPGAGLVQHAAELDTGEATSRSGYRRRSFPTSGNVLVWTFLLVQRSTLRTFLATLVLLVSAIQVQQHRYCSESNSVDRTSSTRSTVRELDTTSAFGSKSIHLPGQ